MRFAATLTQPWAGERELAKQGTEPERLAVLDAPRPPAGRARHATAQEGSDLPLEHLLLQLAQQQLGLGETQAQLLDALVLLVQNDQFVGRLLTIFGDHHQLDVEPQRHRPFSRSEDRPTVPGPSSPATIPVPPVCYALEVHAHISLVVCDGLDVEQFRPVLAQVAAETPRLPCILASVGVFPTDEGVLFLAVPDYQTPGSRR